MPFITTPIKDLLIFGPQIFHDPRGYFYESFNQRVFSEAGITRPFVQDNQSLSSYGTLRGLHLQRGDAAQAKLVRVLKGRVLDVALDLRIDSPTFGEHYSIELSEENQKQFYVPRVFAHVFVVLSETAIFFYKVDNFYNKEAELGIRFDDQDLNIDWKTPLDKIVLSEKDKLLLSFKEAKGLL
jgi:dTDP-4-dehydrorhamnose 3,5-epimerase